MALPLVLLMYAGRIFPIVVRIGTALSRFIAKNPKITGGTISLEAISAAIQSHESTEKEKIDIINDIGKGNPQLRQDILKNIFYPDTNIVSNVLPYLLIIIIIYILVRK